MNEIKNEKENILVCKTVVLFTRFGFFSGLNVFHSYAGRIASESPRSSGVQPAVIQFLDGDDNSGDFKYISQSENY